MNVSVGSIRQGLEQLLNNHPVSTDSLEGWLLIFLIGFVAWNMYKKALEFVGWGCGVILLTQCLYFLGGTGLDAIIPISSVFKYDVLTAIAQCCVGTPLCEALLSINASIQFICIHLWSSVSSFHGVKLP